MQAQAPCSLPSSSLRRLPAPLGSLSFSWAEPFCSVGTPGRASGYTWAGTCGHTWEASLPKKWVCPSWKICTCSFWNGVRCGQRSSGLCDPQQPRPCHL